MTAHFSPTTEQQLIELVSWATAADKTIGIHGYNTKSGFGHGIKTDCRISMQQFNGITDYQPTELVMTARAGTSLDCINNELARHRQYLAFEPPALGGLYGQHAGGSIGGVFMGNLSGPRRFKAGAARDHILGIEAVSGRGEKYKSGGKVIKNVTGYDMSKLLTGSWGTLSIITEVTFKVLPAPVSSSTLAVWGQSPDAAFTLVNELAGSQYDASGLAYLPARVSGFIDLGDTYRQDNSLTLIRLDGPPISIEERIRSLSHSRLSRLSSTLFDTGISVQIWNAIRDVKPFHDSLRVPTVIKLSIPPAFALDLTRVIDQIGGCEWYADAAASWIWVAICHGAVEDKLNSIRRETISIGGSAVLYRAPDPVKYHAGIYSSLPENLAALHKRIKSGFDPNNILNPGRLFTG